ncbi:MAG: hypothetical protein DRZ82_03295 [Thermoprotei archaeon]|nr:MAG: hypothetical protein DRZ82_03295 [Thermoprotei archaeon]
MMRHEFREEVFKELQKTEIRDLHLKKDITLRHFLEDLAKACIVPYDNMEKAVKILKEAINEDGCVKFLGIPGYFIATGARGVVCDLIRKGLIDVIVMDETGIDYDIARSVGGKYYRLLAERASDILFHELRIHRVGSKIIMPREDHDVLIANFVHKTLEKVSYPKGGSIQLTDLLSLLGKEIKDSNSIIRNSYEKGVKLFLTGIWRSIAINTLFAWAYKEGLVLDIMSAYRDIAGVINNAKKVCAVLISSEAREFISWWNQFRGGIDYLIYIEDPAFTLRDVPGDPLRFEYTWGMIKRKGKYIIIRAPELFSFVLLMEMLYSALC